MQPVKPSVAFGGISPQQRPKLRSHPPAQNRIGPHPNTRNAATGIKSSTPATAGFKNKVERKQF